MPDKAQNAADLRRQIAEHQGNLMRLGEAWGQHIVDALDAADRQTIARLQTMLEELKYERNTAAGVNQLEKIRKAIEKIRVKAYAQAEKTLRKEAAALIQNEAKWARRILFAFSGLKSVKDRMKTKTEEQKWLEEYAKENPLPEVEPEPEHTHKRKRKHKHKKLKVKRLAKPTKEQVSKAYTVKSADVTKTLTETETKRVINNGVLQNKRWDEWWTHTADVDIQRVAEAVNEGVNNGQTVEEVTAVIRGTKDGNYEDGLLSKNRQDARRMARTISAGIANEAKDQFYRDNADVLLGVEWLDTLDGRTCMGCASLSRMQWKVDEPHPIPPLHPNCRCVLLPVTALSALVDEQRPAAKADFMAEAKRAYEEKYPGKKFDDLAESTRKKYYYDAIHAYEKRTGQPAFEMVGGRASFKDYFENIMTEQQRKDWLGPERYKLWKSGKYKFDDFVSPWPNRNMTVAELKVADIAGFADSKSKGDHQLFRALPEQIITDGKFQRLNTKFGEEQWELVPGEVKKIWQHPKVQNIPREFMINADKKYAGYVNKVGNSIESVKISYRKSGAPLTATHEAGHLVDYLWVDSKQRQRILNIVKGSDEYVELKQKHDLLPNLEKLRGKKKKRKEHLSYLISDDELFARSFAQHIAQKNKGKMLELLQDDAIVKGDQRYFFSQQEELNKAWNEIFSELEF